MLSAKSGYYYVVPPTKENRGIACTDVHEGFQYTVKGSCGGVSGEDGVPEKLGFRSANDGFRGSPFHVVLKTARMIPT